MPRARASAHRSPDSRAGRPGGRRGRRSKPLQRLAAGYCYVRAHSAGRRPGAGDPVPRAQPGAPDAYAPIWPLPRIVRTCHDTATCPRQNCLHAQRRPRRAHGGNLHPCRRKSFATAAFRRSPARLNHRHVPGNHSVARTPAPQRHAPASQRHAGVQLRPRGGHLDHRGQPARQRRPCRSSWAGAQPALPMMVGALLTPCDQGRHDGCPHRLGGRQEGGVTLKLGLRGFVWRPAAVARCGVITMTNRRITVRCATRSRFIEAMSGARLRCAYLNAEESPGRGAHRGGYVPVSTPSLSRRAAAGSSDGWQCRGDAVLALAGLRSDPAGRRSSKAGRVFVHKSMQLPVSRPGHDNRWRRRVGRPGRDPSCRCGIR